MDEDTGQLSLLKKSGYSDKAIEYYMNKVNVGEIEKPDACLAKRTLQQTIEQYKKVKSKR